MPWKRSDISDLDVCFAYNYAAQKENFFADAVLASWFPGCPEKVIYAAMERAYDRGLIEYGVSLRSGWLTDEGKEKIRVEMK